MTKKDLSNIIPCDIDQYVRLNENTIEKSEALNIKLGYRKYMRIINNKIKEIIANNLIK